MTAISVASASSACRPVFGRTVTSNGSSLRTGSPLSCLSVTYCVLWPNGWVDQDTTWYGGRPRLRRHCIRWVPAPHGNSTTAPHFSAHVYCGQRGRPCQQLLTSCSQFWSRNQLACSIALTVRYSPAVSRNGALIKFSVSRRRRKMYCGRVRLCVCLSVCLSAAVRPHYCTDPDLTWGRGRGCPLVVNYCPDSQSGHGLRCYGNITRTLVTSLRPSRDMTT